MAFLGSGFLYNWGGGNSGSNFVPRQLSGIPVSGIAGGENFNSVLVNFTPSVVVPEVLTSKKSYSNFSFGIYNPNENISPIDKFAITSTFSGLESGVFLSSIGFSPNFYVSGDSFSRRLILATLSADEGISIDRGIIATGQILTGGGSVVGNNTLDVDTFITCKKNRLRYLDSDSWLQYSGDFEKYNFTGLDSQTAGIVIKDLGGKQGVGQGVNLYEVDYGSKSFFTSGSLLRQTISFQNFGANYPILERKSSVNKSWASYDMNSGIVKNSKNVFAYAFEFVDLVTTRDSGVIITSGGKEEDVFSNYRKTILPEIKSGFDTSFSTYIGYCFNRLECPEEKETEDKEVCYTGVSTTGSEYAIFLSGALKQFANEIYVSEFDVASSLVSSSGESISGLFAFQTGEIFYNSFFTGDAIVFNLYNYNYTDLYKSYHLNNTPLYPSTGFRIEYPKDFTDIDTLTNKLNSELKNMSYPVWYPYECLSGEATGIYITGGLMSFEKNTGLLTGDKNYNNIINFKSLRNYQRGFDLRLDLINRDDYLDDLTRQIFRKGFSYLIPNVIELQALTGDRWLVLDRRSGLYNSLTGLAPTKKSLDVPPELFLEEEDNYLSSTQITGEPTKETFDIIEILTSGGFVTLQKFKQKGFIPAPPYCSQNIFEREISIIQPTGWPVGKDPCRNPSDLFDGEGEEQGDEEEEGSGGKDVLELFLEVKRTGWYLDPTGIYLNCLTSPDYNVNKINFSQYRVVARDFSGLKPSIENQYIIPKNEIYFTNINLFSSEPVPIGPHTGQAQCLIGSDYTVDVQDIVGLRFSTDFEYSIAGEDRSGIYRALNQQILYTPNDEERNVKFVRESGRIVENATGFVNGIFTGTGFISQTFGNRYYYNPEKQEIYFQETLSTGVIRSGIVSGESIAIKDFIINQEILVGGRLDSTPVYFERVSGGLFTGLLTGVQYLKNNLVGLYNLTGSITGVSKSGYYNYNELITGSGLIDSLNFPYYPVPTGFSKSSTNFNINFNLINNFDSLFLNGSSITYNSNRDLYVEPDFFSTTDSLLNIINTNQSIFFCTGIKTSDSGVRLEALDSFAPGFSGNQIGITANGSGFILESNFLTGGQNFYPILYPTSTFSGIANGQVASTGFYSATTSGFITGLVPTFTGTRTFTGVWGLLTGINFDFISYIANNYINGISGFLSSGNFSDTINNLQFLVTYDNELNITEPSVLDVAELRIKDLNYVKVFPEGTPESSGSLIFRITGIK
jgi:hypothetical protein